MQNAGIKGIKSYLECLQVSDGGPSVLRHRHLEVWQLVERGLGGGRGGQLRVPTEGEAENHYIKSVMERSF